MHRELRECEISIVADPSVGRWSFACQFFRHEFPLYEYEDGEFVKQTMVDDVVYRVTFGGPQWLQIPFNDAFQRQSIRRSGGCILMYSVTSRDSFTNIRRHHCDVVRMKEEMRLREEEFLDAAAGNRYFFRTTGPLMILVGTKIDLHDQRVVTTEEGQELATELGCGFYEVSAKMDVNVKQAGNDLLRMMFRAGVTHIGGEFSHVGKMVRVMEPFVFNRAYDSVIHDRGFEPLLQSGTVTKKKRCTIL